MVDIESAFRQAGIRKGNKIAILGFDACLMNMLEIAHHLQNQVEFLVGSQEVEPGDGWPYDRVLEAVNGNYSPRRLAGMIVDAYIADYRRRGQQNVTQSAIDLAKTPAAVRGAQPARREARRGDAHGACGGAQSPPAGAELRHGRLCGPRTHGFADSRLRTRSGHPGCRHGRHPHGPELRGEGGTYRYRRAELERPVVLVPLIAGSLFRQPLEVRRAPLQSPVVRLGALPRRLPHLIGEALDHLVSQEFAFSALTADAGGSVYAMNIFAGFSQNNWSEGLCPHAWSLASAYGVGSGRKLFEYQFTDMGAMTGARDADDLFHADGNDEFSNEASPDSKWWDGTASRLRVHQIGPVGATITFRTSLRDDEDDLGVYKASSQPNAAIPDKNAVGGKVNYWRVRVTQE